MRTEKIKVAVYGQTLLTDAGLFNKLDEKFIVLFCKDASQVWNAVKNKESNVVLLEIGANGKELKILKELQDQYPKLHIISLGLEKPQEHLISAFKYGSNDFFKIPLNIDLLIERIEGIVKKNRIN